MAKCSECGDRTKSSSGRCRTCKFAIRRGFKQLKAEGGTVELVGGAWWVFDKLGNTIVCRSTKFQAVRAFAQGGPAFEGGDDDEVAVSE